MKAESSGREVGEKEIRRMRQVWRARMREGKRKEAERREVWRGGGCTGEEEKGK